MGREALNGQESTDISPDARKIRAKVLRENIRDSERLIAGLEAERVQLIMRLSQIPGSITTVKEWIDGCTQELDKLEGHRLNNGHSTPIRIPSLSEKT